MSDRLEQLYQEVILDHNKNPRNFGQLDSPNAYSHGLNPLCGDDFHLYLKIDQNDIIQDLSFQGQGCAISKSSASLMTSFVKGKSVNEALELQKYFHHLLTEDEIGAAEKKSLGRLSIFSNVKNYPVRVKCATLIWHALGDALRDRRELELKQKTSVSTEHASKENL